MRNIPSTRVARVRESKAQATRTGDVVTVVTSRTALQFNTEISQMKNILSEKGQVNLSELEKSDLIELSWCGGNSEVTTLSLAERIQSPRKI